MWLQALSVAPVGNKKFLPCPHINLVKTTSTQIKYHHTWVIFTFYFDLGEGVERGRIKETIHEGEEGKKGGKGVKGVNDGGVWDGSVEEEKEGGRGGGSSEWAKAPDWKTSSHITHITHYVITPMLHPIRELLMFLYKLLLKQPNPGGMGLPGKRQWVAAVSLVIFCRTNGVWVWMRRPWNDVHGCTCVSVGFCYK